mmetsp:Transcript_106987/g.298839  ORF Transcript_106987/g.298839 Transcript_106987/m.298839 type:complete len:219 (-) Transcript_106987:56-712(-)
MEESRPGRRFTTLLLWLARGKMRWATSETSRNRTKAQSTTACTTCEADGLHSLPSLMSSSPTRAVPRQQTVSVWRGHERKHELYINPGPHVNDWNTSAQLSLQVTPETEWARPPNKTRAHCEIEGLQTAPASQPSRSQQRRKYLHPETSASSAGRAALWPSQAGAERKGLSAVPQWTDRGNRDTRAPRRRTAPQGTEGAARPTASLSMGLAGYSSAGH